MVTVLFLFPKSVNLRALDDFLLNQLIPMVKQIQSFRSVKVSDGDIRSPAGPPPYSKIVELTFDTFDEMMMILQSQKAQPDKSLMEGFGPLILLYDVNQP